MFSRQYLDELDMQIERTRRAYKWSQAMVLGMAVNGRSNSFLVSKKP